MKNALEQHLVTKSGREPGGLSAPQPPPPFSRQGPLGCSTPCLGYGATSAQSCCSSSCLCWSCPGLRGQALLPFSPVTGAKATNSCTQSHLQHQGQEEAASFGQCRALPWARWALCAPTDIQQTQPEIPHFLYQHWATPARKGWAITSCWGDTLKIASIPEHQKCPAMNCKSLITVIL